MASTANPVIVNPNVSVLCRFRPMNDLEKTNGNEMVANFVSPTSLVFQSTREKNKYRFNFDQIFSPLSTQEEIYNIGIKDIINSVLNGYNGTVLAYGQTSSGKTFTMQGNVDDEIQMGIIPRMVNHVFGHIYDASQEIEFMVKVSMIEIYQEKIRDGIETDKTNGLIREDPLKGIYIEDISEHYVACEEEVLELIKIGTDNRAQACTNMNEHSSRSHSIFIMTINQNNKKDGIAKTGKLYLVDGAGSEKISKTGASGHTLEEAKIINKSLTTGGMVINSLTDGKSTHIPYRESKGTRVLQESLGGNSKTALIITCSPSIYNESESGSTLRFGERAKKIKNKPKINKEVTVAELQKVIQNLESELAKAGKRIRQLETFIKQNGGGVPKCLDDFEMAKALEQDEIEKNKEKEELKNMSDERLLQEYKANVNFTDTCSITEKILSTISAGKESEDENENKIHGIGQGLDIKDKLQKKELENEKTIEQLRDELDAANKIKERGQGDIIDITTRQDERSEVEKFSCNGQSVKVICDEFAAKMKNFNKAEPKKLEVISEFQEKINGITTWSKEKLNISAQENQGEILKNKSNSPFQVAEGKQEGIISDKVKVDGAAQTEGFDNEIEKLKQKYENEKKILFKTIDEKCEKVCLGENEISDLEEKFLGGKEQIPFDSKNVVEKMAGLNKNLLEMKQKLQISQAEKGRGENENKQYSCYGKEKIEGGDRIEKENNELKDKTNLRGTMMYNVVKVIKGKQLRETLTMKSDVGKSYMK